jgi:tetratricopeptide (TPR) repeat protein
MNPQDLLKLIHAAIEKEETELDLSERDIEEIPSEIILQLEETNFGRLERIRLGETWFSVGCYSIAKDARVLEQTVIEEESKQELPRLKHSARKNWLPILSFTIFAFVLFQNYRILLLTFLGRYEEATNSYDKALTSNPGSYKDWYDRGKLLLKLSRYEESIVSNDKAIKIKPDYHEAWNNRGISLDALGRREEAIAGASQDGR